MEKLREILINLIELKGIASEEVIKISTELDEVIVKYYQEIQNKSLICKGLT